MRIRPHHCKTPPFLHLSKEVLHEDSTLEVSLKLKVGIRGRDNELIRVVYLQIKPLYDANQNNCQLNKNVINLLYFII